MFNVYGSFIGLGEILARIEANVLDHMSVIIKHAHGILNFFLCVEIRLGRNGRKSVSEYV